MNSRLAVEKRTGPLKNLDNKVTFRETKISGIVNPLNEKSHNLNKNHKIIFYIN